MNDHPYAHGSFAESVCLAADDLGVLTECQLARLLAAHSFTLAEYLADFAEDRHVDPRAAETIIEWLGY